jgi:primosomal protein N'
LQIRRLIDRNVADLLHFLRKEGNLAAHQFETTPAQARSALKIARDLALWFHRSFGEVEQRSVKAGAFQEPVAVDLQASLAEISSTLQLKVAEARAAYDVAELARQKRDRIPFVYGTNGRPFLQQLQTKSGIWFRDVRQANHHGRALLGWHSPNALKKLLEADSARSEEKLQAEPFSYFSLRDYQVRAAQAVAASIANGQRECLVAMATGTGKTRTVIGLIYRLLKSKRFIRILFLVDRTSLGEQAQNAFKDMRLEQNQVCDHRRRRGAPWLHSRPRNGRGRAGNPLGSRLHLVSVRPLPNGSPTKVDWLGPRRPQNGRRS